MVQRGVEDTVRKAGVGSRVVECIKKRRKRPEARAPGSTGKNDEQTHLSTPPRREHKSALRMEGSMS